ncbi:phage distal tail protein, Rcc01695 family [Tropicimonas sp. S265A]|uniref:phage distal tail protein, Rcc01695 family n=1 Tax=Tropicimonas sp. S265A TaxID=3415134 RepID=UPI003C7E54AC
MQFHDVRFPANLSFGSLGGPERRTEIVSLANGYEERNTPWAQSRRRYDAGVGMRSLDDIERLIGFFEARQGQLFGFRWKDWSDFKSCEPSKDIAFDDQIIGTGDGVASDFGLMKTYRSGAQSYARPIAKPVAGTVKVGVNGTEMTESVDFTIETNTGQITFVTPPAQGVPVSAGFEFDVPVRFDTERIQTSVASFQAGEIPSVPIVEIRL